LKEARKMKRLLFAFALIMLLVLVFSPSPSYCKTINTPDGAVYKSACGRIFVGQDIYYWLDKPKRMLYVGRVIEMVHISNKTVVWIRMAGSKRTEVRMLKSICDWGWVKVKEANK
jgi:hypothetical protein